LLTWVNVLKEGPIEKRYKKFGIFVTNIQYIL
jgi:hypothetical protein